jgi:FkbM family methyltransferase
MKYELVTVEEHTLSLDVLNEHSWILDLGCLNFKFSNYFINITKNIICVDANPKITTENGIIPGFPIPGNIIFINKAISNQDNDYIDYYVYHDINGNSIYRNDYDYAPIMEVIKVQTISIERIMSTYGIEQFDLIKFDIEGAEYDILEKIDFSISKQFSIEFHDFRNFVIDLVKFYNSFLERAQEYCHIVKHEKTQHPGWMTGTGINHWDSLFILKKEYWK